MKISVVVPVYNVEMYLRKCLDSILNQTVAELEIILVNDGSTDSSGNICEYYKTVDNRVVVVHKENGGLSSARNIGIEVASGELIGFVDSDDWIEPDFYEILLDGILMNDADISVVQFAKVREWCDVQFTTQADSEWKCFSGEEAMRELFSGSSIGYSAVNKLYRKELFEGLRYPEGMLMEDKATTYRLIHNSNKIAVNGSRKYHYYLRRDSITRARFDSRYFDTLSIHEEILGFIDLHYPNLLGLVQERYVHAAVRLIAMMIWSNHSYRPDFDRCIRIIKKYIKRAIVGRHTRNAVVFLAVLCAVFPDIAYLLTRSRSVSKVLRRVIP